MPGACLLLLVAALVDPATGSETPSLHATLILQLSDVAGVPGSVLRRAENEVTRVYAAIGVYVQWSDGTADRTPGSSSASQPLSLRVTLLPNETGDLQRAPRAVLGAAVRASTGTQTAWAFYGRVQQQSDRYGLDDGLVLGHTVAHEIGHLLLPGGGHSSTGLMQKCWTRDELSRATQGQLRFTAEQAGQIRAAVTR